MALRMRWIYLLNENKVKMMTKMAIYEKNEGRKMIKTAKYFKSDYIAFGAMKAIKENGLKIPEDISVIGFDDAQICNYTTPTLTTIHAPAYDMGQYGANFLFGATNCSITTPLNVKMPCELVERESCGPVKNKESR